MRRRDKRYVLDQCALYRCRSRRRLFQLLQTSQGKIAEFRDAPDADLYRPVTVRKKNGEPRPVLAPRGDLKRIQKRVSELLMRVAPPGFLMAPARGRSHIDNAARHRGAHAYRLLDVADFFPSCSAHKVAEFLGQVMGCPPDVVAILVRLTTREGVLPQGSPASPVLAYWAYRDMWDEVAAIAHEDGCTVTIYIDDITISGPVVRGATVHMIKERLRHHGHRTREAKEAARVASPVTVTGVVVRDTRLLLPNAQHLQRHRLRGQVERLPWGSPERAALEAAVVGHTEAERQIRLRDEGGR